MILVAAAIALAVETGGAVAVAINSMQQAASMAVVEAVASGARFAEAATAGGTTVILTGEYFVVEFFTLE